MRWQKLGLVYAPDGQCQWAASHAMIPTPVKKKGNQIRVFVTFCDENGIGRPGYVDVCASNPKKVIKVSETPLMDIGQPGTFDENGIIACSVIKVNDLLYLYYVGFELGMKIPYRLLTGLAISKNDGESFERIQQVPVLERSHNELNFRCGPYVINEDNVFKMWYVAGSNWITINEKQKPIYDIRYIESNDGIHWPNEGKVVLSISNADEHGFGRPCVIKNSLNEYIMFYSIRRKSFASYRLGMAKSLNGHDWTRMDEALNLDVSKDSFDSKAIMYSAPFLINGQTYLFYNGNDFGRDGFAVAKLMEES